MKNLKNLLAITAITLFLASCKNDAKPEVKTVETAIETTTEVAKTELDPNATYAMAEFNIEGMTCAMGCAKTIEKKLAKMEGVRSASVDFDKKLAMVEYDNAKVTPASLEETVTKVGETYKVTNMKSGEAKKECSKADGKKEECKKKCDAKAPAEKTACAEDCKKDCCGKAEKA